MFDGIPKATHGGKPERILKGSSERPLEMSFNKYTKNTLRNPCGVPEWILVGICEEKLKEMLGEIDEWIPLMFLEEFDRTLAIEIA